MPQTRIEKKFFRVRVDQILHNWAVAIPKKLAVVEFQKNKDFQKNITAGGEK